LVAPILRVWLHTGGERFRLPWSTTPTALTDRFGRFARRASEAANPAIHIGIDKSQLTPNANGRREIRRRWPMAIGPMLNGDRRQAELSRDFVDLQELHG